MTARRTYWHPPLPTGHALHVRIRKPSGLTGGSSTASAGYISLSSSASSSPGIDQRESPSRARRALSLGSRFSCPLGWRRAFLPGPGSLSRFAFALDSILRRLDSKLASPPLRPSISQSALSDRSGLDWPSQTFSPSSSPVRSSRRRTPKPPARPQTQASDRHFPRPLLPRSSASHLIPHRPLVPSALSCEQPPPSICLPSLRDPLGFARRPISWLLRLPKTSLSRRTVIRKRRGYLDETGVIRIHSTRIRTLAFSVAL